MRNKLIIGDIPGRQDVSGVLFDFMKKWHRTIFPSHLIGFLLNKEAWIGEFNTAATSQDGLLDELRTQLLSGAKSVYQFKLFVNGLDYLDPWRCQLEAISEFYKDVFNLEIRLKSFDSRYAAGGNFMFFPCELNLASNSLTKAWEAYRIEDPHGNRHDRGLRTCEAWNANNGVSPDSFLQYDTRNAEKDYLLYYSEKFTTDNLEDISRFTYPLTYKRNTTNMRGLTLREVFILTMFEFWKTTRYFTPRKDQDHYLAIPCYGSVCVNSGHGETNLPIPLVIMTEEEIETTWATNQCHIPGFKVAKIYKKEDYFVL